MGRSALGQFEHHVLLAILRLGRESYSVAIVAELEDRTAKEVPVAAVYVALRRLEKRGFLRSQLITPEESGESHPRRFFTITDEALEPLRAARQSFLNLWDGLEPVLDEQ